MECTITSDTINLKSVVKLFNKKIAETDSEAQTTIKKSHKEMTSLSIFITIIAVSILVLYFLFYPKNQITVEKQNTKGQFFGDGFESGFYNSTPLVGIENSTYSFNEYSNIPENWIVHFGSSGEFQWVNDTYYQGSRSVMMSDPGEIGLQRSITIPQFNIRSPHHLTAWVKSNGVENGFAFVELGYINNGNYQLIKRSGKVVESVNWHQLGLSFNIPNDAEKLVITLKFLNKNHTLYNKLPNAFPNSFVYNSKIQNETVWFDFVRLQ